MERPTPDHLTLAYFVLYAANSLCCARAIMSAIMKKSRPFHRFLKHFARMMAFGIILYGLPGVAALQARQPPNEDGAIPAQNPLQAPEAAVPGQDQGQATGQVQLNLDIRDLMPDILLAAPQTTGSAPSQGYAAPGQTRLMLGQQSGTAIEADPSLMPLISNDSRRYIKAPVERIMPELDQPALDDDQPTVGLHMKVDF